MRTPKEYLEDAAAAAEVGDYDKSLAFGNLAGVLQQVLTAERDEFHNQTVRALGERNVRAQEDAARHIIDSPPLKLPDLSEFPKVPKRATCSICDMLLRIEQERICDADGEYHAECFTKKMGEVLS